MAETELLGWVVRLAEALREAKIPHALAGGLALAVHGHPRATTDIDFVITADPEAIARARLVLAKLGILQTRRPIVKFRRIAMLRVTAAPELREPISIDLLVPPDAMDQLFARIEEVPVEATAIAVVSREDLVLLKLLRASDQDVLDIRALASKHPLDRVPRPRRAGAADHRAPRQGDQSGFFVVTRTFHACEIWSSVTIANGG